MLRDLERRAYQHKDKAEIISSLEEVKHNYTAFFVCRNPVDKLLSVYNYLMDARVSACHTIACGAIPSPSP